MSFRNLIRFGRKPAPAPTPTTLVAADTPEVIAKKAFDIGDILKDYTAIDMFYDQNPLLRQYLGEYKKQATYFRADAELNGKGPETPTSAPPFTQMLADMHRVYRSRLPMRTNITLDVEALRPETRKAVQDMDENLRAYREAVEAKMKVMGVKTLPFDDFKDDPSIKVLIVASKSIAQRLANSDLENAAVPIPVIMDGKKHLADNTKFIGGALYALSISSHHQLDSTKVPPAMQDYCTGHVGKASAIHKNMRRLLSATPSLAKQYDEAIASCMPDIAEAIGKGAHTLQVLNAMKHHHLKSYEQLNRDLLNAIGADHFPARLETPLECTLVLNALIAKRASVSYDQSKIVLQNYNASSPHVDEQALRAIEYLGASSTLKDEDSQRQVKLVSDYIASPPQSFTAMATREQGQRSLS